MVNYNTSKIYKIVCNNTGLVYYGSTTQKYLSARLEQHRQVYHRCTSRKILNGGNYDILLVENVNCNSKDELRARERFYIENNECVNKVIPGRTQKEYKLANKEKRKEYDKKYQLKNKEKCNEIKKEWRINNKNKCIETQKKYYQKNKEKIAEQQKIKISCSCGSTYTKHHKTRHERTKRHREFIQNQNSVQHQ